MRRTLVALLVVSALAAFSLAGCGNSEEPKSTAKQVKPETKEAVGKAVPYTKQQQEEWMVKAKAEYQELLKQGSLLMNEAKPKVAAGQAKAKEALSYLEKQQTAAREKIDAAQASSGEAWEKAKVELQEALKNLKEAYQTTKAKLAG